MINLTKVRQLVWRAYTARGLGLRFAGTSRFKLPQNARLAGKERKLSFPPDDNELAWDIINLWLDDEYGLRTIAWPVKTILDIGGNVGLFSLWARHHFPTAQIDVYEPNPMVLPYLSSNLDVLPTVRVFPEGVADMDGCAHMAREGSSRFAQTRIEETGDIRITGIRRAIDRLNGEVDLMKLDCEGAEWLIFKEAEALSAVREIRMEYHLVNGRTIEDLRVAANHIGFDITKLREYQNHGITWLRNKHFAK